MAACTAARTLALCARAALSGSGSASVSRVRMVWVRCARLPRGGPKSNAGAHDLQGKVILITGGAKRVGAAICRRLHAAGANLMLHYRASAGEARLLQAELNHVRQNSVALIQADLLDIAKLPAMVEQTLHTFGHLDVLINNASSFFPTPVGDITAGNWDDLIGTNVRAPLFLAQAAAAALRRTQGAIVNITDIHAERPLKNFVVYSVAKAGL